MAKERGKFYNIVSTLLRTLLAVLLIGGLIWYRREQFQNCLAVFDYSCMIPVSVLYFLHIVVCAGRWRKLARLQGFTLGMSEALSLTMQGNFFSLIIPGGAIGGDVVKMGLLAKRCPPGSRAEGIFTIFMDRVIGMIALFLLTMIVLLQYLGKMPDIEIHKLSLPGRTITYGAWLLLILCAAGISCGVAIFFHRTLRKIPGVSQLMNWTDRHVDNMVSRMTTAADMYSSYPGTLILLTVITLFFVHLATTLPLFFTLAGAGVEIDPQTAILIISAATIGNVAGLLPFTPGGIGIRDLTVIALLSLGGIDTGVAETAQIMATAITVLCNLSGGVIFVCAPALGLGKKLKDQELS